MKILVLLKMVPDVVEELDVAPDGKSLNQEFLRMIVNERDNHALEEALLLKEEQGGSLDLLTLAAPEIDDALFTGLAKGANRAVKVTGLEAGLTTRVAAAVFAQVLLTTAGLWPADLILTGVQAIDDLDGLVGPLLAQRLGIPYVGIVSGVEVNQAAGKAMVVREYPGGVRGEFEVALPAVLGIQAAEKPPRYVPVAKVRAAMKSCKIETVTAAPLAEGRPPSVEVLQMSKPEATGQAEMLDGSPEEVAGKLVEILSARGLL